MGVEQEALIMALEMLAAAQAVLQLDHTLHIGRMR